MQGLSDFYHVQNPEIGDGILACTVVFNADHDIFKGHFPQQPVVPGVCTMHIVKALLEAALSKKLLLKESSAVKFLRLMTPDSEPTVSISWEKTAKGISATATFKDGDVAAFKMIGIYAISATRD